LGVGKGYNSHELNQIYNACHCTILPSRGEGFGLTILESMSAGVPVITTDYSGHADFARKGGCIFADISEMDYEPLTNIGRAIVDIEDLKDSMRLAYEDQEVMTALSAQARSVANTYDWKGICEAWEKVIRGMDLSKNKPYPRPESPQNQAPNQQKSMGPVVI
jgi:glycosyltransferase involved in cell wall biosynthesis